MLDGESSMWLALQGPIYKHWRGLLTETISTVLLPEGFAYNTHFPFPNKFTEVTHPNPVGPGR